MDMERIEKLLKQGKRIYEIAKQLGMHRNNLYYWFKKNGFKPHEAKFNHDFFAEIDSEEKAYWLGFIMADGCVSTTQRPKVQIKLASVDEGHLLKWHKSINSCNRLSTVAGRHKQSTHYSKKMCDDLIILGCVPRKSLILTFPEIDSALVHHFVRGYFDGDGCISIHNKRKSPQIRITFVGTSDFLSKIASIINKTNVKMNNTGKAKILSINGTKQCKKILNWMYKDATVWLDRKREVYHSNV